MVVVYVVAAVLGHGLLHASRWGSRILPRLVADRGELNGSRSRVAGWRLATVGHIRTVRSTILGRGLSCLSLALLVGLAGVLLLLLPSLPLLADFFELCTKTQ